MPTLNPYNELGQILASGGEISVAIGFAHGKTRNDQLLYVRKRFAPLPEDDETYLLDYSESISGMDSIIKGFAPHLPIPIALFPQNPFLFGDDFGGMRVAVGFDAFREGDDSAIQIRTSYADAPSFEEILRDAEQELERRKRASPGRFKGMDESDELGILIHILYAERRY